MQLLLFGFAVQTRPLAAIPLRRLEGRTEVSAADKKRVNKLLNG